jgi:predicted phosphodiesterase
MRIFALSDIHVDYELNAKWVANISAWDYRSDSLILCGDVSDSLDRLKWCLNEFAVRFKKVLFVPGNHELWVIRDATEKSSLQKFHEVASIVESSGASMEQYREKCLSLVPLFGWYDYSFGEPSDELRSTWMDYHACRWPPAFSANDIAVYFESLNEKHMQRSTGDVITFSHFLPRIDLMPKSIPMAKQLLYPVLGTLRLERQLRQLKPCIHVYGHSHVNRKVTIDGVCYINNAFGYPQETSTTSKRLLCIYECN